MTSLFLFDSNTLITPKRSYYAFDITPSYWQKLNAAAEKRVFVIIDRVYEEILHSKRVPEENEDELSLWLRTEFKGEIVSTRNDSRVVTAYAEIVHTMTNTEPRKSHYKPSAKNEFARAENADPWLVAYAYVHNCRIVTYEVFQPETKKKIKIPNVCEQYGVKTLSLHDFMRTTRIFL